MLNKINSCMKKSVLSLIAIFFALSCYAIERKAPQEEGMDPVRLAKVDDIINASIENKEIPGAVLAVVRNGSLVYLKAYGNKSVYPEVEPMTENTVFDLASCSKVVGTTMSVMHLFEQGGFRLTDRVDMYIPGFEPYVDPKTGEKVNIRIVDLLTHSSGLPAYVSPEVVIKACGKDDPDSLMSYICKMKREFRPTTDFQYSCLNFITLQNILQNQYANYQRSEESVELINRKYHDLKHQIAVLRREVKEGKNLEYLDRVEQEISAYEAENKTGNRVLDTILTTKSLHCRQNGIQLTCVADGAALDFMDVMDLSALFGNALDNAIEGVSVLPGDEQRLIHLSVARQKGFVSIRLENRCKETMHIEKGLPSTTKAEKGLHGYGLKSIQATVAKYGGSVTVHAENGWFELRILIPLLTV